MKRAGYIRVGIAAYALVGLVSFGHSAAQNEAFQRKYCTTAEQRIKSPGLSCYSSPEGAGLGAAILWPLYWSWELQQ